MTIYPVDNFGTVVGENPDCLLLSGTVVGENPDHVCWVLRPHVMLLSHFSEILKLPVAVGWHLDFSRAVGSNNILII